jgi:predicted transcriptional regulator of viral defense system
MPMVKFTPSPEQREVVAALSAAKMPLEKIAASIINPRTQRAISVKTLGKLFKDQLDAGVGSIVEAYRGLRAALEAKEAWAIKYVRRVRRLSSTIHSHGMSPSRRISRRMTVH